MYINCLKYEETYSPHAYTFTGPCVITNKQTSVTIPSEELHTLRTTDLSIQKALPSLSASDREFVKTGISAEGWERMFNERT